MLPRWSAWLLTASACGSPEVPGAADAGSTLVHAADVPIDGLSSDDVARFDSGQREIVLNPSLGATYELSPRLHLGLDSWLRGEYPQRPKPTTRTFGLGPAAYLGPAAMFNFGKLWWALGVYTRITDPSHDLQPGEPYGPIYVRSLIGYDL